MAIAFFGNRSFLYGDRNRLYGMGIGMPFAFYAMLQTDAGVDVARLNPYLAEGGVSFSFKRFGGCGEGRFRLRMAFFTLNTLGADYRIKVYINSQNSNDYTLIYSGYVTGKNPVYGEPDMIDLTTQGFSSQLQRVIIGSPEPVKYAAGATLLSMIQATVQSIALKTQILYSAALIDNPAIVLQNPISYQKRADECMNDMAGLAGNFEWGVDCNRYFYFKAPSAAVQNFWSGRTLQTYSEIEQYDTIKNRCLVPDGSYTDTYEAETDLVVGQSQAGGASLIECGTATSMGILQTFQTSKKSISRIRIYGYLTGAMAANMVTDGDMETSGMSAWQTSAQQKIWSTDVLSKSTAYKAYGTQGLCCDVAILLGGVKIIKTTSIGYKYSLRWWAWVGDGELQVVVDNNLDGIDNRKLAVSDIIKKGDAAQKTFQQYELTFTATTTTTRIYLQSTWGMSKFYLDNIVLRQNSCKLVCTLINAATGAVLATRDKIVENITTAAPIDLNLFYYGAHLDAITTYGISIMPVDYTGVGLYWVLQYNAAGGLSGGQLYHWDGGWVENSNAGLKIDIYYNNSQETYGLREEISSPVVHGADMKIWVNAYLAGLSATQKRASFQLEAQRESLHSVVPSAGLGMAGVKIPGGTAIAQQLEQLDYNITEPGMAVSVTAGQRLPDIAYRLKYLEHKLSTSMSGLL